MTEQEIEQFLTCARVGRLGLVADGNLYIVPVGYAFADGKLFFHACGKGLKIEALQKTATVCFEVDETLSDSSMWKSVMVFGTAEIISNKKDMIPYLQRLIDKYRVPEEFEKYMKKPGRDKEKELEAVRICIITPNRITGKKYVAK
jgi:nitroimidazol reductase NimA-like FMN-containing flavoprotein (pyridoxamine 5'-phosphate oxidase superfamily)